MLAVSDGGRTGGWVGGAYISEGCVKVGFVFN